MEHKEKWFTYGQIHGKKEVAVRGWCKRCSTPQLCASQVGSILTGTSGGTQSIDDAIVSDGESDQDHEPQRAEIEGVALASDIGWGICIHRLSSTRQND